MKYLKYMLYLIKHKWFVGLECFRRGLILRGIVHDVSKFYPSEFFAYADYFYGTYPFGVIPDDWDGSDIERAAVIKYRFNRAWLKHQHRNKHHWQYWVLVNDDGTNLIIPMPKKYVSEMVCDWIGAGRAIKGRGIPKDEVVDWYLENRPKMILCPETVDIIVQILSKKFNLEPVSLIQGVKRPLQTGGKVHSPKPWPEEPSNKTGKTKSEHKSTPHIGYKSETTGAVSVVIDESNEGKIVEADTIAVSSSKNQPRTKG